MADLLPIIRSIGIGKILTGFIILILLCFEITPIKFNPISWIFKKIGKMLNGEVVEKVNDLQAQVNVLHSQMDSNTGSLRIKIEKIQYDNARRSAINYRTQILQFGDELRRGISHSKENFDQIIAYIDGYQKYCKEHPEFENNKTCLTTAEILDRYKKCMDDNNFL